MEKPLDVLLNSSARDTYPLNDSAVVQPPCQFACPLHQDVRSYVAFAGLGKFKESLKIITDTNPLPSICGTICAHPCESQCRRSKVDSSISIRALKRAAIEYGKYDISFDKVSKRKEKIAIIGAGPAGLTAAYDLAALGFNVAVFEKELDAGGALSSYIPLYRLPRDVINNDVTSIVNGLDVKLQTGCALGSDFSLGDLIKDGFQAIILALGLPVSRTLNIPGAKNNNVFLALPFLKQVNSGNFRFEPGKEVIVIGGGNVAMDVARSALRCGAEKVKVTCLESREEMPAFPWEIEEAVEEGIEMNCSLGPKELIIDQCGTAGITCRPVKSVFDADGKFSPTFYDKEASPITGNIVIIAIGQTTDLQCLQNSGVQVSGRGEIIYDKETLLTTEMGVYACGELITGPGTAVQSMASGRRAAVSIARHLISGEHSPVYNISKLELDSLTNDTLVKIKKINRIKVPSRNIADRKNDFQPVELGYSRDEAVIEARRCLSCGAGAHRIPEKCISCLTCVRICPYGAPVVTDLFSIDIRVEQCQACGLCIGECPAKAITFNKPGEEDLEQIIEIMLRNYLKAKKKPVILTLYCSYINRGVIPSESRGKSGQYYISVPCISRVDVNIIFKAFELGVKGVILAGCKDSECPYQKTMLWQENRIKAARRELKDLGIDENRLMSRFLSPGETSALEQLSLEMVALS